MLVQIIVIVPDVYSILEQINTCPKHLEGSYWSGESLLVQLSNEVQLLFNWQSYQCTEALLLTAGINTLLIN